jgi:phosphoglycolate phosphatase-like HAD superfamily hydrolase
MQYDLIIFDLDGMLADPVRSSSAHTTSSPTKTSQSALSQ